MVTPAVGIVVLIHDFRIFLYEVANGRLGSDVSLPPREQAYYSLALGSAGAAKRRSDCGAA